MTHAEDLEMARKLSDEDIVKDALWTLSAVSPNEYVESLRATRQDGLEALSRIAQHHAELVEEARNRKHYSDSPRSTLHSWNDHDDLDAVGGRCGLCEAVRTALSHAENGGEVTAAS